MRAGDRRESSSVLQTFCAGTPERSPTRPTSAPAGNARSAFHPDYFGEAQHGTCVAAKLSRQLSSCAAHAQTQTGQRGIFHLSAGFHLSKVVAKIYQHHPGPSSSSLARPHLHWHALQGRFQLQSRALYVRGWISSVSSGSLLPRC